MDYKKVNKICNFVLIAIGIMAIICAMLCFILNSKFDYGYYIDWQKYGGDAYTGIQNAAAATANQVDRLNKNVETLANCIKSGLGFVLLISGLLILLHGIKKLLETKEMGKNSVVDETEIN